MDSPSIDYILTRWAGALAGLAKGPDGYGPHAVEVVCAALDKALTERDKWRTYCEGARESVAALTAERDEARRQLAEALARVAPTADTGDCRTCKWADAAVCHHPEGKRKNSPVWTWCAHALAEDLMTRLGTSPPCPGYARKES